MKLEGEIMEPTANTSMKAIISKPDFKRGISTILIVLGIVAVACGIEANVEELVVNDVEHDIEVDLLDIKTSYLIDEIEFREQDESSIYVDVNATTGVCSLTKIAPPWWKELILQI